MRCLVAKKKDDNGLINAAAQLIKKSSNDFISYLHMKKKGIFYIQPK